MKRMGLAALLVLGVVLALAPNLTSEVPDRDSGVFLYVGQQLLEGRLPYLDVWDHKGPLIYLVNALAVLLSPGGEGGLWLLEALSLGGAAAALLALLRRELGGWTAGVVTALFLASVPTVLFPGNYTEEFTLPLQAAAFLCFSRLSPGRRPLRWAALIGAAVAGMALLRPNNAGLGLAVVLYLAGEGLQRGRTREAVARLAALAAGAAAVVLPVVGAIAAGGALAAMLDALVRYSAVYVRPGMGAIIDSAFEGLRLLAPGGVILLGLAGWTLGALAWAGRETRGEISPAWRLAVLALPLEVALIAVSGRSQNHYYLTWLVPAAVLAGGAARAFLEGGAATAGAPTAARLRAIRALALLAAFGLLPLRRVLPPALDLIRSGPRDSATLAAEVQGFLEAQDSLLMWGAEAGYNYFAGRPAPTRFVYQYPLYACDDISEAMRRQFADEVRAARPVIVDTAAGNDAVPPLDPAARAAWAQAAPNCALSPTMLELLEWIGENYAPAGRTPRAAWEVYRPLAGPG